jgi:hypothetical protein
MAKHSAAYKPGATVGRLSQHNVRSYSSCQLNFLALSTSRLGRAMVDSALLKPKASRCFADAGARKPASTG